MTDEGLERFLTIRYNTLLVAVDTERRNHVCDLTAEYIKQRLASRVSYHAILVSDRSDW